MLQAEADGLQALAATHTVRVPAVDACVVDGPQHALLALEWLDVAPPDAGFGARFGSALAALHLAPIDAARGRYGWRRDNRIGGDRCFHRPVSVARMGEKTSPAGYLNDT